MAATAYAAQQTLGKTQVTARPYLATLGAPALRFQDPVPVPPPTVKPIASGPPVAASAPEEAEVSLANDQAAASTPPFSTPSSPADPTADAARQVTSAEPTKSEPAATPRALPILPDDTRRKVQSQDFLPLFRLPGPIEDSTVIVPAAPSAPVPGTVPHSSATYRVN